MQLFIMYLLYYLSLKMGKFVVFGKYCEDAIIKREPFREQHLNRLKNLKDRDILVTLGPTKCTKYLFGIFNACLLYTSPSPRDNTTSRMPSSA